MHVSMGGRTQTLSKNEPLMMATRDAHPRVYSVSCAFLHGDHLTNPASATLLTISFVMCSPIPQTHKTRFRDVAVWGLAGLLLLRRFFTSIRRCCENDDVAFLERVGLLLVGFLTRSVQRSCFRPGTRRSSPCGLFRDVRTRHTPILLELVLWLRSALRSKRNNVWLFHGIHDCEKRNMHVSMGGRTHWSSPCRFSAMDRTQTCNHAVLGLLA